MRAIRTTPLVHWRFAMDPPELFTVMSGEVDGVHWGYFFDEPNRKSKWIVQTYANDAYDLRPVGLTLPGGLRWCIEARQADADEYGERPPSELEELRRRVVDLQLEVATPMQRELLRKDTGIRGSRTRRRSRAGRAPW